MISKTRSLLTIAIITIAIALVGGSAIADQHLVIENSQNAYTISGTEYPATTDTTTYWIVGENMRVDIGDSSFIYLPEQKLLLGIDHPSKEYFEMPFNAMAEMIEQQAGNGDPKRIEQLKAMFKISAKITPTDETKKIGEWNCRKFNQEIGIAGNVIKSDVWACKDLIANTQLMIVGSNPMGSLLPGFDEMSVEFEKIEGVPVQTVTSANFGGVEITTTSSLLLFEDKSAPKGTLDIPEGYKKAEMMPGEMGG